MRKILVADDNPVSRELVREILELRDYQVIEASDGRDALLKISENDPELVLLDVQMPVLDGFQVLEQIRRNPHSAALRVVALTAYAMRADRERALGAGFDGYITKPINAALLRTEIERLLP